MSINRSLTILLNKTVTSGTHDDFLMYLDIFENMNYGKIYRESSKDDFI